MDYDGLCDSQAWKQSFYERRKDSIDRSKIGRASVKEQRSVLYFRFFSPLIATMYTKDDWGNLEEYGEEVFPGLESCSYETEILKRIARGKS